MIPLPYPWRCHLFNHKLKRVRERGSLAGRIRITCERDGCPYTDLVHQPPEHVNCRCTYILTSEIPDEDKVPPGAPE